jgi:hypothetical protein
MFDSDKAGMPVYTLAENEVLAKIVEIVGLDAADATASFCRAVRTTLYLDEQGHSPLRWHTDATKRHAPRPLETPPSLPLLVVFTIAAKSMHADTQMAANNFYGRVRPLLQIPNDREYLFVSSYQKHADLLWRSLNVWLEAWEGERGVPTAYSLGGMRHVGLPMSQAVVRQHDRLGLIETFEEEGIPPGSRMSPEDMESALDAHTRIEPSPLSRNIRNLWSHEDARIRIVQAACLELESWNGTAERGGRQRIAESAKLVAYLRTFPRTLVEFNLSIPAGDGDSAEVVFTSSRGEVSIPAVMTSAGTARLASIEAVSAESLVGEALNGWLAKNPPSNFSRRPRRVVPLRWDELQGCYIEVERISLGEENLVLATFDAEEKVTQLLDSCARPGWGLLRDVPGMPNGWILLKQVQVVSIPEQSTHVDLIPLVSRSRSSMSMRGGFDLPGRLRKWSSLQPPEVIAYASDAASVSIRLSNADPAFDASQRFSAEAEGQLAILTLANYDIGDGEYIASMFVDGETKPRSSSVIRLRSADTPVFRVDQADMRLVYSPRSGALWPLTAGPPRWPEYVNGGRTQGEVGNLGTSMATREFAPRQPGTNPSAAQTKVPLGDVYAPDSCMVTGRHRFELPPALGGRPPSRTIEGECTTCGLVKRFAATPWAADRRRPSKSRVAPRPVVLPPITSAANFDPRVLFDAICHVGQGSYHDLERVAGQVEGSGLYADTFLRSQEVLGHIDVRRDEQLQVSDWAVNASTIVPLGDDSWVLVGSHSQRMLDELRKLLGDDSVHEHRDRGVLRVELKAAGDALNGRVDDLSALEIELGKSSTAFDIAAALPALSRIETGLGRISVPGYRTLERWDTQSASWTQWHSLSSPGAYRLKNFKSLYVVRSDIDLENETVAVGTAQLVKHIANRWSQDPLMGYHTRTKSVVMPLGTDLPALYGRALALCSGIAPIEHLKGRMVQYPDVPREVADVVFDRLSR